MVCKNCGKEIPNESEVCPECGSAILVSDNEEKEFVDKRVNKFKNTSNVFKIGTNIALILLSVFLYFFVLKWYSRYFIENYDHSMLTLFEVFKILWVTVSFILFVIPLKNLYNLTDSKVSKLVIHIALTLLSLYNWFCFFTPFPYSVLGDYKELCLILSVIAYSGILIISFKNAYNLADSKVLKLDVHIAVTVFVIVIFSDALFSYTHTDPDDPLWGISILIILIISYNFTDSQISKRKERRRIEAAYRESHPAEAYKNDRLRKILIRGFVIGILGLVVFGVYSGVNRFLKDNNYEIKILTKGDDSGPHLIHTLYDDRFYVAAQSHVPIYFSISADTGKVSIKATSDRQVEFITMSKHDYENRISLLFEDYQSYQSLSSKNSVFMETEGYLPKGDYVFVVQCVGLHVNEREVHVTIKEIFW